MADDTPVPARTCRLRTFTTGVLALFAAAGAAVVVASLVPRGHRGRRRLRRTRPWNRWTGPTAPVPSDDRPLPDDEI
ncbi:hypothetical protein SAMN05443665_104857 [Actinomadura meyerae]|jgi:hypothetical protein|uniref:Uncharacterized protein n=1 Tax=Actinomadura meyerae TaxID=240840 RepID=A0A239NT62_9ACTN|nr:hypothetical protein [Actinomadura meyerae]SNT58101.1 hypothetical protein SAMN05443665_104857 [Actinomadura meyerae]